MILRHGSKEQKEKYLSPSRGVKQSQRCFHRTRSWQRHYKPQHNGVKDGGEFIKNGSKMFITNGPISKFTIVLCQTDPTSVPTSTGQSALIVEQGHTGFTVLDIGEKMGNSW
jgi:isovaleryl-CoA dehydrogenase